MTRSSSVGEALAAAIDALTAAGVEQPRLDAELLLGEAAGLDRAELVARPEAPLDGAAGRRFGEMVRRRLRREPVAYILGRRWFRHLELRTDPRALIPRPETEHLVEAALALGDRLEDADGRADIPLHILDVGTGSGAVALALAAERPGWRVTASDTSAEALSLARENAELHGLVGRVELVEGTIPPGSFDLIVANLPYIAEDYWPALAAEIRDYEPRTALLAGADGLDVIRAVVAEIAARWPRQLPPIALEIGSDQAEATAALLSAAGWSATQSRSDLAGHDRVVVGCQ